MNQNLEKSFLLMQLYIFFFKEQNDEKWEEITLGTDGRLKKAPKLQLIQSNDKSH